ncbi:MAG: hypothetical protein IK104_04760 [Clostridia bacterium]|nr:hypothetical protein [Clostridia bacterium]
MSKLKSALREGLETVFIPKESKHDDALYVAVNGRRMLVRKGESVALPLPFAAVVRASQEMKRAADSYIDAVSREG